MKIGIRAVFAQGRTALLTSSGLSLSLFVYQSHSLAFDDPRLPHQLLLSTLLFLSTFLGLRLFNHMVACSVNSQLALLAAGVTPYGLRIFVVCKELVKCVVGLSLTLAWGAGLLYISAAFEATSPLITVGVGSGYSLLLFSIAYLVVHFVDRISWSPDW